MKADYSQGRDERGYESDECSCMAVAEDVMNAFGLGQYRRLYSLLVSAQWPQNIRWRLSMRKCRNCIAIARTVIDAPQKLSVQHWHESGLS